MDGQTATLVDDRKARLTETPPHPPFCGPPEVNGLDWLNELPDAFQTDDLPLGTMGFVRLGGLDPSPFTIPRNRTRCRFAQIPDDDGPPSAHAKSSLQRQEFAVNDGVEDRPVVGPQVPTAATASIEARATTRAPSEAPATFLGSGPQDGVRRHRGIFGVETKRRGGPLNTMQPPIRAASSSNNCRISPKGWPTAMKPRWPRSKVSWIATTNCGAILAMSSEPRRRC